MKDTSCRFCARPAPSLPLPWNTILLESPHFVVMPSLGALVEGWLLIVSKAHYLCMGALPPAERAELQALTAQVSATLEACYGPVARFEHGPAVACQQVGCGVDHAHLHLVPTDCDLLAGAREILPDHVAWESADGLPSIYHYHAAGLPYLYLEQQGRSFAATAPDLPSQFFRKVLARHVGEPGRWNWRECAFEPNVAATVAALTDQFAHAKQAAAQ